MSIAANATMSDDDLRRQVASAYAADATDYRELWAPVLHPIASTLVAGLPAGRRVLDMGTGVGTLLPLLRQRLGAQLVVGVDLTPEMLSLADSTFTRLVGDAGAGPLRVCDLRRRHVLAHRDEVSVDEFVERRLRLGSGRRHLHALAPDARRACVAVATDRVRGLEPKDFWADWRFVLATALA